MSDPSEQPTRNDSDLDEKKINNILPTDPESELNIISSCLHEMLQIHFEDNLPSSISSASNKEKLHLISTQLTSQSNSISELESILPNKLFWFTLSIFIFAICPTSFSFPSNITPLKYSFLPKYI